MREVVTSRTRVSVILVTLVAAALVCADADAEQPPHPRRHAGACARPLVESSSWLRLGYGGHALPEGDGYREWSFGAGGDMTFSVLPGPHYNDAEGYLRIGPYVEVRTFGFDSLTTLSGISLSLGQLPANLDLFQFEAEGALQLRFGAGYDAISPTGGAPGPVMDATLSYAYRAPWRLWRAWSCDDVPQPPRGPRRRLGRYMVGVELYVSYQQTLVGDVAWQVTSGLEFEPAGAIRYLFGLY